MVSERAASGVAEHGATHRRPPHPAASRYCKHNPDAKHNSCDIPQELTDAEIDLLHTGDVGAAAHSRRQGRAQAACAPAPTTHAATLARPSRSTRTCQARAAVPHHTHTSPPD